MNLEFIKDAHINELPQIRSSYDPESIDELATSMLSPTVSKGVDTPSSRTFNLINPLLVGRHDFSSAKRYLNEHNEFYEISSKQATAPSDLIWNAKSSAILIAGHRRRRAIARLGELYSIPINDREILADVRDNISFDEGLALQARENTYSKPPAYDEARVIARLYRSICRQSIEKQPPISQIAKILGYSESKVRDAIAFDSLPREVQDYAVSGLLSFTTIKRLKPLYDVLINYYSKLDGDQQRVNIISDLVVYCNKMLAMVLSGDKDKSHAELIKNRCQEITGSMDYQQLENFFIEDDSPQKRLSNSYRKLANLAIRVIKYGPTLENIDTFQVDELLGLLRDRLD